MIIRHDMKRIPRATMPPRSARRIANARRAVEADREACGLFPEMARFQTAEERLDHIDAIEVRRWQGIRDHEARNWKELRRRLRAMPANKREAFLDEWNSAYCPAEGAYALDRLRHMFPEEFTQGGAK